MIISLLLLLFLFSSTFAASCENKVRLADLQDIIKNQTKLIGNMEHVIEDQKNLIENQAISIENQTRLYEDLKATVEHLKTGKMRHYLMSELKTCKIDVVLGYNGEYLSLLHKNHPRNRHKELVGMVLTIINIKESKIAV